jgi:hypothetical protein
MNDLAAKVTFLAQYVELVATVSRAIPNDHAARVFGRALFLGLDSFLVFAPALKNACRREGTVSENDADSLRDRIEKLRGDYTAFYERLRHKGVAHQQEVGFEQLFELWNEIDQATLTIFADDVKGIVDQMGSAFAPSVFAPYPRVPELDDAAFYERFASLPFPRSVPSLGVDRFASTRPQTVAMIPGHPTQEKSQRIVTTFDHIRIVTQQIQPAAAPSMLARKAILDLAVVDLCSAIDNLFVDRAPDRDMPADPSLLTLWRADHFGSVRVLASFPRNADFEKKLREVRNKASAHIDSEADLDDLLTLMARLPVNEMTDYLRALHRVFQNACRADIRSLVFAAQGTLLQGAMSVHDSGAMKPFSS